MRIEAIAIGAGILAAIALLVSRAKAAPTELLTLDLECIGGTLDACPLSSNLKFTGGYTLNDSPVDDTIHIFQFDSESDANSNIGGTRITTVATFNGNYNITGIGIAPSIEGTYYYKAFNDDQSDLVELASI